MVGAMLLALADPSLRLLVARLAPSVPTLHSEASLVTSSLQKGPNRDELAILCSLQAFMKSLGREGNNEMEVVRKVRLILVFVVGATHWRRKQAGLTWCGHGATG